MTTSVQNPRSFPAAVLALLLSMASPAWAHSNEHLATMSGAHGGMLRMAEMYHFELVVKDGEAHVWVTDHGDMPQSTKGAVATLRVINGTEAFSVSLQPSGRNELVAKNARLKSRKGTKMVLTVSMDGEAPLKTRYAMD